MASVRKRTWQTKGGPKTAWIADYFDQDGERHIKTFSTRGAAKDWLPKAQHEIGQGAHVPDSTSQTLREAVDAWITRGEAEGLESSTMRQRRLHKGHILALLDGDTKLSRLSVTKLEAARDDLLLRHSRAMARKVIVSLKSILRQAKAVLASANLSIKAGGRHRKRLKAGVDFPTAANVKATIEAAADNPKARALVCLAAFAGLRASELRGLGWVHLDLGNKPKVTIEERADELGEIGSPKSEAARREIGLNETTVRALKEWKLAQPPIVTKDDEGNEIKRPRKLVFGTATDRPDGLANLQRRLVEPVLAKAKVKHYGLHAWRHFAISSWLKTCNGDLKAVQTRAGHATLALTLDTYGHLLDKAGEGDHIAAAEKLVLG
jgi:integrase